MQRRRPRRREVLGGIGAIALGALAGCVGGDAETRTPADNEVLVGPNNSLSFTPEELTVSSGTTVTWTFESTGHNVSCVPENWDSASLPDGAAPFASYEDENSYATRPVDDTFERTFEIPGTYEYVCVPHINSGMIGTIIVEA